MGSQSTMPFVAPTLRVTSVVVRRIPPFHFPLEQLSTIVGDTPGVSLRNDFPDVLPAPCTQAGMPQYQLPIALDDLFFSRVGDTTPGIGYREIPTVFAGMTQITIDLFRIQDVIDYFYDSTNNEFK